MGDPSPNSRHSPSATTERSTTPRPIASISRAESRTPGGHHRSSREESGTASAGPSRHRLHEPSGSYPRPEHRPLYPHPSYRSSGLQTDHERSIPPLPARQYGPPAFASYLPPIDDRQFAFGGTNRDQHGSRDSATARGASSGQTSVPPPQRIAPPHIAPSTGSGRSQPPPSPPASRGTYMAGMYRPPSGPSERYSPTRDYRHGGRLPSPPGSRGDYYPIPPRSSHRPLLPHEMGRTLSQSSQPSGYSAPPTRRLSMTPSGGSEHDEDMMMDGREHAQSEPVAGGGPALQRPKRTRVLMTHLQQNRLGALWKESKFPSTQEREDIAQQVGLTPRQVQVWFQNRRQTFRKQIQQNAIPQGSDPADYADLQKSPRSRRMSLEAANAAADEADRAVQWRDGPSVITGAPFAARVHGGPELAMSSAEHSQDSREIRIPASRHVLPPGISPSPPRRPHESDRDRHLPPSRHGDPPGPFFRPTTASSSSSYHAPVVSYPGGLSRQYSLGSSAVQDERIAGWDRPGQTTSSPSPYSPPPTAEGDLPDGVRLDDRYSEGHKRPRRRHTYDPDGVGRRPSSPELDRSTSARETSWKAKAKPSHLPPSLAALAINRPIEYGDTPKQETTLPSLGLVIEPEREITPRLKAVEWDRDVDGITRSPRGPIDEHGTGLEAPTDKRRKADLDREVRDGRSSSASSLPRFNDLFR